MSGIGGIMDINGREADGDMLCKMQRALIMRGRRRSSAFIGGNAAMFFNSSAPNAFEPDEDRQPNICKRRGSLFALAVDGEGFSSSALLERYFVSGVEFLGSLEGGFALALYDGERDMLLLARDRRGIKPLYYSLGEGRVYFSSEPKGILACCEQSYVDKAVLSAHLTAPMGIYGASDIYTDIYQVKAGECLLFTAMGMSKFFYKEMRGIRAIKAKAVFSQREKPISCVRAGGNISETLSEALIAFDCPCFDMLMPSLCRALGTAREQKKEKLLFADGIRRSNPSYAYEREDRLGGLYGIHCLGVISRDTQDIDREQMRQELLEYFFALEPYRISFLGGILGKGRLEHIIHGFSQPRIKKEDAETDIRILGMLLQTVDWAEANRLLIKGGSRSICYDCF